MVSRPRLPHRRSGPPRFPSTSAGRILPMLAAGAIFLTSPTGLFPRAQELAAGESQVYVAVLRGDRPVMGLGPDDFRIEEDGDRRGGAPGRAGHHRLRPGAARRRQHGGRQQHRAHPRSARVSRGDAGQPDRLVAFGDQRQTIVSPRTFRQAARHFAAGQQPDRVRRPRRYTTDLETLEAAQHFSLLADQLSRRAVTPCTGGAPTHAARDGGRDHGGARHAGSGDSGNRRAPAGTQHSRGYPRPGRRGGRRPSAAVRRAHARGVPRRPAQRRFPRPAARQRSVDHHLRCRRVQVDAGEPGAGADARQGAERLRRAAPTRCRPRRASRSGSSASRRRCPASTS